MHPHTERIPTLSLALFIVAFLLTACVAQPSQTPILVIPTSILTMLPSPAVTPTPDATAPVSVVCTQTKGEIRRFEFTTDLLKYPLKVNVYMPPCYSAKGSQTYPVLYMLHGMTDTNQQWIDLGLTDAADKLIAQGDIHPLIIVMPNEDSWQLTPEQSKYEDAIVDVLIPWVDEHFSTCSARQCRAIGGLSRGGNWAVKIGLEHWDLFAAIGAHSTPLFSGGISWLTQATANLPSIYDAPAMYLDVGNKDENLRQVTEFESTLTELGIAHEFHQNTGYHEAAYWSAHVTDYLLWYASILEK